MALIFSARSVGYLLGAFIGGFLFDIFDKQLLLTATLLVAAVATMIIPWALTLVVLAVMFSLQGVAMGVLDTGNMFLYYMCIFLFFIFYFETCQYKTYNKYSTYQKQMWMNEVIILFSLDYSFYRDYSGFLRVLRFPPPITLTATI
jgi:hypothetical protein